METRELKEWFDFDSIEKGMYISPEEVERVVCVKRQDRRYGLKLMRLQEAIETACALRQYPVSTCQQKEGIRILTDAEASAYNYENFKRRLRGMKSDHGKLQSVDTQALALDKVHDHDRRVRVSGLVLQSALSSYRDAVKAIPYKRSTPTLVSE